MNEKFMICNLRFTTSNTAGGRHERVAVLFKSSVINHQS